MRNIDGIFNHKGPIEHMMEVELFYKEHKERSEINCNIRNAIISML